MTIFAIIIVRKFDLESPFILTDVFDLTSLSYTTRTETKKLIKALTRSFFKRTNPGQKHTMQYHEYSLHAFLRKDFLGGAIIGDLQYSQSLAFSLLPKILDIFKDTYYEDWETIETPMESCPFLLDKLKEYQDPNKTDNITAIKKELKDTSVILTQTVENVMVRGEKLDNLVSQTENLNTESKVFYKEAKKVDSCCPSCSSCACSIQ